MRGALMFEHQRQLFREGEDHGQGVLGNRHRLHAPSVADDDAPRKQLRQAHRLHGHGRRVHPPKPGCRRELVSLQYPRVDRIAIDKTPRPLLVRGRVDEFNVGKSRAQRGDGLGRNLPLSDRLLDRDEDLHFAFRT